VTADGNRRRPGRPDWSTLIAVVSLLVSIFTLLAMFRQTSHLAAQVDRMREQTELAVNDAFYAKAFEMQQIFLEHPDLWPYFHNGKDLEEGATPEKIALLEAVALLKLDYFELVRMIYRADLMMDEEDIEATRLYMRHGIDNSPVLRRLFERHRNWYPKLQPLFDAPSP
jgi:hypothetical protein